MGCNNTTVSKDQKTPAADSQPIRDRAFTYLQAFKKRGDTTLSATVISPPSVGPAAETVTTDESPATSFNTTTTIANDDCHHELARAQAASIVYRYSAPSAMENLPRHHGQGGNSKRQQRQGAIVFPSAPLHAAAAGKESKKKKPDPSLQQGCQLFSGTKRRDDEGGDDCCCEGGQTATEPKDPLWWQKRYEQAAQKRASRTNGMKVAKERTLRSKIEAWEATISAPRLDANGRPVCGSKTVQVDEDFALL